MENKDIRFSSSDIERVIRSPPLLPLDLFLQSFWNGAYESKPFAQCTILGGWGL